MTSNNITRELSHHRRIDLKGYRRSDGDYDIEATLIDTKGIGLSTPDRTIPVGEELHRMLMCLTIDSSMTVKDVDVSMDATPYESCSAIAPAYKSLIGASIAAGWSRQIKTLFSGVKGCTHLRELLGPMATVAFQTVVDEECRSKDYRESETIFRAMIDSCYGLDTNGVNVPRLWPDFLESEPQDNIWNE